MAKKRSANEIDRLRMATARTRGELGETWRALRHAWRRRRSGEAVETRAYAGSKPERRRLPRFGALAAAAFGLAMVIPRMARRRSATPET